MRLNKVMLMALVFSLFETVPLTKEQLKRIKFMVKENIQTQMEMFLKANCIKEN